MAEKADNAEEYYDAFVIYNPEALDNLNFVKKMADILEGPENNFRLYIPWRDDQPSDSSTSDNAVTKKCRRAIVILTNSFENCPTADFQLKMFLNLSPGGASKSVVPLLVEECPVPAIIKFINPLIFYREETRKWQWQRVASSLKYNTPDNSRSPAIDVKDALLDSSNAAAHRQWWADVNSLKQSEET